MNKQIKFLKKISPSIKDVSANYKDFRNKLSTVSKMLANVSGKKFQSIGKSQKLTGLSYLLGKNSSAKIVKGKKKNYLTGVLYLAAADMSGFNLCPMATQGCKNACLISSGRARMISTGQKINNITWSRLMKSWLFMYNRHFFMGWLNHEIKLAKNYASRKGLNFAVRLNGTSDINIRTFQLDGKNILDIYPTTKFYDYTKVKSQVKNAQRWENYDVTFSFANSTEFNNLENSLYTLSSGEKISVVFDLDTFPRDKEGKKQFPKTFLGYPVANGDETDLTFLQQKQVLGLDLKKTNSNQSDNKFVLNYERFQKLEKSLLGQGA